MTSLLNKPSLKHLGSLHGIGSLSIGAGKLSLGSVAYEIDGYLDRDLRWANGQIEGPIPVLAQAFSAGSASIALLSGNSVDILLRDPEGGSTAAITVSGRFPL